MLINSITTGEDHLRCTFSIGYKLALNPAEDAHHLPSRVEGPLLGNLDTSLEKIRAPNPALASQGKQGDLCWIARSFPLLLQAKTSLSL